MNRCGYEPPKVRARVLEIERCSTVTVYTIPTTGRVSSANFIIGTYLGFKAISQCRNPSIVITPSSGRSEVSLVIDVEELKDIDRPGRVSAYGGVGITICNMLNGFCGNWKEERLS